MTSPAEQVQSPLWNPDALAQLDEQSALAMNAVHDTTYLLAQRKAVVADYDTQRDTMVKQAHDDIFEAATNGALRGEELLGAVSEFVYSTGSGWHIEELEAAQAFREKLVPGELVLNNPGSSASSVSILAHNSGGPDVEPVLADTTLMRSPDWRLKVAFRVAVQDKDVESFAPLVVVPGSCTIGREAIMTRLDQTLEGVRYSDRIAFWQTKLEENFALLGEVAKAELCRQLGVEQAKEAIQQGDFDAPAAIDYLQSHASEELQKVYDKYAVEAAMTPLTYQLRKLSGFLHSYLTALRPTFTSLSHGNQNREILTAWQLLLSKGMWILRQQEAAAQAQDAELTAMP